MIKSHNFEFSPSTSKCLIRTGGNLTPQIPPLFFSGTPFLCNLCTNFFSVFKEPGR